MLLTYGLTPPVWQSAQVTWVKSPISTGCLNVCGVAAAALLSAPSVCEITEWHWLQSLLMTSLRLDISLPFIKQQAVTVLTGTYATTGDAMRSIASGMHDCYETKYPDVANSKQLEIRNAVTEVQEIFRRTAAS